MEQDLTIPRWAGLVPGVQLVLVTVYVFAVVLDNNLPDFVTASLVLGSPVLFGAALGLGWWVSRKRGGTRPDGSEYMIATFGNVIMGFGLALSVVLWGFLVTFPDF